MDPIALLTRGLVSSDPGAGLATMGMVSGSSSAAWTAPSADAATSTSNANTSTTLIGDVPRREVDPFDILEAEEREARAQAQADALDTWLEANGLDVVADAGGLSVVSFSQSTSAEVTSGTCQAFADAPEICATVDVGDDGDIT